MDEKHFPATPVLEPAADDSLLTELASLTSLFSPEQLWLKEEQLDSLEEQQPDHPQPNSR